MNISGIIAEYNPFHNGHKYHIDKTKQITGCDKLIALMSGNFVQRGEPAIVDKWLRTKMALENGVDMVIELPTFFSTSSAELFASASVFLLKSTDLVSSLCFGCESDNVDFMYKIADTLTVEPSEYQLLLKSELAKGISFPVARKKALNQYLSKDCSILDNPNNILGIEYIKALIKYQAKIKPFCLQREIADYHSREITQNISSACAIREALKQNQTSQIADSMPRNAYDMMFEGINPAYLDELSEILHYRIATLSANELAETYDITEGLENRIIKASKEHYLISDIVSCVKTKRYTYTKLQRILLHIILNINKKQMQRYSTNGSVPYIRILGFRKESESLISLLSQNSSLPVITNIKKAINADNQIISEMLEKEAIFSDIYYLSKKNKNNINIKSELAQPIIIV